MVFLVSKNFTSFSEELIDKTFVLVNLLYPGLSHLPTVYRKILESLSELLHRACAFILCSISCQAQILNVTMLRPCQVIFTALSAPRFPVGCSKWSCFQIKFISSCN
jgi:hypothetical protein